MLVPVVVNQNIIQKSVSGAKCHVFVIILPPLGIFPSLPFVFSETGDEDKSGQCFANSIKTTF